MSKWPKTALEAYQDTVADEFEVIPADLGRELYEAARDYERAEHSKREKAERVRVAVARYEREVKT